MLEKAPIWWRDMKPWIGANLRDVNMPIYGHAAERIINNTLFNRFSSENRNT